MKYGRISIGGGRQSGKTHNMLDAAIASLDKEKIAKIVCVSREYAKWLLPRLEERFLAANVQFDLRADNGEYRFCISDDSYLEVTHIDKLRNSRRGVDAMEWWDHAAVERLLDEI